MEDKKNKIIEEIDKEIADMNSVCEKLKQKIDIALNSTVAIYNPLIEYTNLKKVIKEFLELKFKIVSKENKKDKYREIEEIIEKINKE